MRPPAHPYPNSSSGHGASSRPYWICFVSVLSITSMAGLALLFMSSSESISQPAQAVSRIIQDSTATASSLAHTAKSAAVSILPPAAVALLPGEPFDVKKLSPFQEYKLRQQMFCEDAAPLAMPDAHYVHTQGVDMFVYSKTDHVSSSISSGLGWEAHDVEEIMWALSQPLPGAVNVVYDSQGVATDVVNAPRRYLASSVSSLTADNLHQRKMQQPNLAEQKRQLQRTKGLFVDIGANVGWFTLYVASRGYDVAAFEGMHSNVQLIRSSLCMNSSYTERVVLYPFGLGGKTDVCYIFSDDDNKGDGITMCGKTSQEEALKALHGNYHIRGVMAIRKLDDVLDQDVKVMKMDVEGYEPFVLQGALQLLSKKHVWYLVLEFNIELLKGSLNLSGRTPGDVIDDLTGLGYSISTKSFKGPFMSKPEIEVVAASRGNLNFYCVHKDLKA